MTESIAPLSPPFSLRAFQHLMAYLCHELISPLSAIVTGVDLLSTDGDMMEDLLPVLETSSNRIRARLEYYRSAFGPGGIHLSLAQTRKHISQMWPSGEHETSLVVFETTETVLPPQVGQHILLLALWGSLQKGTCTVLYTEGVLALCLKDQTFSGDSMNEMLTQKASENDCNVMPHALLAVLNATRHSSLSEL